VGPRTCLDDVEGKEILPLLELELRPPPVQPVASRYTDCSTPALPYDKQPIFNAGLTGISTARITLRHIECGERKVDLQK
jgi:hypothetical protein